MTTKTTKSNISSIFCSEREIYPKNIPGNQTTCQVVQLVQKGAIYMKQNSKPTSSYPCQLTPIPASCWGFASNQRYFIVHDSKFCTIAKINRYPAALYPDAEILAKTIAALPTIISHLNWLIKNANEENRDAAHQFLLNELNINVGDGAFDDLR